jgi:hypothetical protein
MAVVRSLMVSKDVLRCERNLDIPVRRVRVGVSPLALNQSYNSIME